jgi:hypothetical protein
MGGGGGGWGWGWPGGIGNPYGGYMQGAADITTANAQYQLTTQQAKIVQEQARREQLDTQKANLKQMDWERAQWLKQIDPETQHQKELERALRRSMNFPPNIEIWNATALNAILKDLQLANRQGVLAPSVPLDQSWLPHVNLTTGVTSLTGVGMLKNMTKFNWPVVLRRDTYAEERKKIEELTRKAVEQAPMGEVDAGLLDSLNEAIGTFSANLEADIRNLTPSQYIQGNRYLTEMRDSLKVLQDPNVANYFNKKWAAKGNTVNELAVNMTTQGLTFAPAASGDEPTYSALYNAMATYVTRLRQMGWTGLASSGGSR